MSKVFGVCCHSPEELIVDLLKVDPTPFYYCLKEGDLLINCDIKRKIKHIIILTNKDFVRNWKAFSDPRFKNKNIFVCAAHDTLLEFKGITKLDYVSTYSESGRLNWTMLDFIDLDLYKSAVESQIKRKKVNYVNKLVSDVRKGSVLNSLMTFIYMLNVKTHQKPVKILCGLYLTQNWSAKKLDNQINLLGKKITLTSKMVESIKAILSNPISLRLQQAFQQLENYDDADIIAKQNEVSGYEIRYIINMLRSEDAYAKKTKTSIDDYLDNKHD